jgi:hypothetical protein
MIESTTMTVEMFVEDTKGYGQFLTVFMMGDSTTLRYMLHLSHHLFTKRSFNAEFADILRLMQVS